MSAIPEISESRITAIAPQFLVDDLEKSIAYYRDKLGFDVDFTYESFYAGVSRNGMPIHLKCAPKTLSDRTHRKQNERLDAYVDVSGVELLEPISKLLRDVISRPGGARHPHLFPHKLRCLRSSERELTPLITF